MRILRILNEPTLVFVAFHTISCRTNSGNTEFHRRKLIRRRSLTTRSEATHTLQTQLSSLSSVERAYSSGSKLTTSSLGVPPTQTLPETKPSLRRSIAGMIMYRVNAVRIGILVTGINAENPIRSVTTPDVQRSAQSKINSPTRPNHSVGS